MIDARTLWGYAATTYAVTAPDGEMVGLRLEESSAQADALLRDCKARSLTCMNAWNPLSRRIAVSRNMAAHQRLRRDLDARGLRHLPHLGVPDSPHWRPEPGFAVFDLETEKAIGLAQTYGQYAVVRYARGGIAELILTRWASRR